MIAYLNDMQSWLWILQSYSDGTALLTCTLIFTNLCPLLHCFSLSFSEISSFKLQRNNLSEPQDSFIIGITGDTVPLMKLRDVKTTKEKLMILLLFCQ